VATDARPRGQVPEEGNELDGPASRAPPSLSRRARRRREEGGGRREEGGEEGSRRGRAQAQAGSGPGGGSSPGQLRPRSACSGPGSGSGIGSRARGPGLGHLRKKPSALEFLTEAPSCDMIRDGGSEALLCLATAKPTRSLALS